MYRRLNSERRFIIKSIGALGLGGVLIACGGGSDSGSTATSNSSGTGGGSDPTNASKAAGSSTCTNSATIPLIIDASVLATGIPANIPIYAYVIGLVAVPGDVYYRYSSLVNKPVQMSTGDNLNIAGGTGTGLSGSSGSTNYPQVWADYAIPLDRTCATVAADLATFNTSNIPGFGTGGAAFSGRIFISVGTPKIPFTIYAGSPSISTTGSPVTGYASPSSIAGNAGSLCMFDWLEFSYDGTGALNINTTQVDQYGFPISMVATGIGVAGGEQGLFNTSRSGILSALAKQSSSLFNGSVAIPSVGVASGTYPPVANTSGILRALAPPNTSGAITSNYLATPIKNAMDNWTNNILSVTCPSNALQQTYYGKATGNTLNFYTSMGLSTFVFSFGDINTINVLNCSGSLAGVGVSQTGQLLTDLKNTGKAILAGFNRGVITSTTTVLNITQTPASAYAPPLSNNYQSTTIPYNTWALNFHQFSSNGYAYGFSYDDVGAEQPTITTTTTTSLKLQLGLFQ